MVGEVIGDGDVCDDDFVWRPGICIKNRCQRHHAPQNCPQHHTNYWTPLNLQLGCSSTRAQARIKKVRFANLPSTSGHAPWESPAEMIGRWTYGSKIKCSHPSRTRSSSSTSEGGTGCTTRAASMLLFPPGARHLFPPVHPPRSPPHLPLWHPPPATPQRLPPRSSPLGPQTHLQSTSPATSPAVHSICPSVRQLTQKPEGRME